MLMAAVARGDPWRFQAHPEIWALIAGLALLYVYAIRRIGPRVTRPGEVVVTRSQVAWFVVSLTVLWAATDWPVHDLGEEYLYSVHMAQHLMLSFVVASTALLATPTWLARLVIGQARAYRTVKWLTRFVPATLFFNGVVVFSHWPVIVNASASNGLLHYGVHVLVMASALVMWMPVCGPLPELRFSLAAQMPYLFLQSVIPTLPAGWLTFAEGIVYRSYDVVPRVWDLSPTDDQQIAGMEMKILGGFFLWTVITVLFVRFATKVTEDDRASGMAMDRRAPVARGADGEVLTWEQVQQALDTAPPAPAESDLPR